MIDVIAFRPPPGVWLGLDTAGDDNSPGNVITPELARGLVDEGYFWVARYTRPDGVVLDNPRPGGDWHGCWSLSIAERNWILEAGLGLITPQFAVWGDAKAAGRGMAMTHQLLGLAPLAHHYFDVEGAGPINAGTLKTVDYINTASAEALSQGGSTPAIGLYRTDVGLSARQTYGLKHVTSYWRAAGPVPADPAPRGNNIEQDTPRKICGILADPDTMRPDRIDGCPVITATRAIAARWHTIAQQKLIFDMIGVLA